MFEQAVLSPPPVRRWAVTVGFAGECVLVAGLLVIPLVWPQLLPRAQVMTWITAPAPPPPPVKRAELPHVQPAGSAVRQGHVFYEPRPVERTIPVVDQPPVQTLVVPGGTDSGEPTSRFKSILDTVMATATPPRTVEAAANPAPRPAPAPVQQVRVSGTIQAAKLVHRVDPVYPVLARQARVSGTVELAGVIGTDGRIRELHVTSGHPLLVQAALDAVRQWIYQPTSLGGTPVEVITTINVIFRLN